MLANASNVHTLRWANALAESGCAVDLISAHPFSRWLSSNVRQWRLRFRPGWGYFLNVPELRKLLQGMRPTLLHAHYASGYGTLARMADFHPFVLSVWGADVYDVPRRTPLHRRLVVGNLRRADIVCSTSHVMAAQCRALCPFLSDIRVISFGVDVDRFRPAISSPHRETLTIGTVKTLHPKYGVDTLILAFARCRAVLRSRHSEWAERMRLRIVGDGPERSELERLARTLAIDDVTTFVGAVPHVAVPDELELFDVFVAASRFDSESFGVAVIEASACGLPVVVSDAGGLPEVVQNGVTGIVVPRDNPAALAEALRNLIVDTRRRRQMGDAGRRHVVATYDWRLDVQAMLAVYREIERSSGQLGGQTTQSGFEERSQECAA